MEVTTDKRGNLVDTLSHVEQFVSPSRSQPRLNNEDSKGERLSIVLISQDTAVELLSELLKTGMCCLYKKGKHRKGQWFLLQREHRSSILVMAVFEGLILPKVPE